MRTIRAHFHDGDSLVTDINGTEEEIRRYYVGQVFNLGDGAGGDRMARCTSVEFLDQQEAQR